MTHKELYNQVLHLGFENTALESDDVYIDAVNRALYQVNAIRPRLGYADILHYPPENVLGNRFRGISECYDSITIPVEGCKVLYVELAGDWRVSYQGGEDKLPTQGNTGDLILQKFLVTEGVTSVTITANTRFVYRNAMAFKVEPVPVPGIKHTGYNLANVMRYAAPPIIEEQGYGYITEGYRIEGSTIYIDNGLKGLYRVAYHTQPTKATLDRVKSDDLIQLDEDLCSLLPLLVASYVWLEDEPERSEYYYSRYQEQAIDITRKGRVQQPTKYMTNGW